MTGITTSAPAVRQEGPRSVLGPPGASGGRGGRRRIGRRTLVPWLFLLAPLSLLLTFTYIPVVNMVVYSFHDWNGISKDMDPVGVENYIAIFTRPEYFRPFFVSLYYFGATFLQMALALYFATVLSFPMRMRNLFKGILFFPYLINGVAIGFTFLVFFQPGGTLDTVLGLFGLESLQQHWLGDRTYINWSLAGTSIWRYMGLNFVLFLAAIQSIDPFLYEASSLDGANRWHQFRHIILPSIRPIIGLSFILAISGSLAVFEIPFIMTDGANGSETFVIQTVKLAFENRRVGLASAMAVVLLLIVLLVTWVQRRLVPDEKVSLR